MRDPEQMQRLHEVAEMLLEASHALVLYHELLDDFNEDEADEEALLDEYAMVAHDVASHCRRYVERGEAHALELARNEYAKMPDLIARWAEYDAALDAEVAAALKEILNA
jgi:hypothetical protein